MKQHTTNYYNTFIEVAEDTKADSGTQPPTKEKKTVAKIQYDLLVKNPYQYTSDELLFQVFAERMGLAVAEYEQEKATFFSKGQACLRASPLAKTYGFGIHFDSSGKIGIYGMETPQYTQHLADKDLKKIKAIRNKRKE